MRCRANWGAFAGSEIFDNPDAKPLDYKQLTTPGQVAIIDLSDTDSPRINNLVIAGNLRGIQQQTGTEELHGG